MVCVQCSTFIKESCSKPRAFQIVELNGLLDLTLGQSMKGDSLHYLSLARILRKNSSAEHPALGFASMSASLR